MERIGQPDPRRDHIREDQQDVDVDEDIDEALQRRRRVGKHDHAGADIAHDAWILRNLRDPCGTAVERVQAWLKKPPLSIMRARSSADTSTLRGVSRKTLSATRCMLPSSAYVRPLAKSISRFESSLSALWRLRITGTESLNLSAICCASLKLRGSTRCALTLPVSTPRKR